MTISLKALHEKREQLKAGLAQISDLRPGSLTHASAGKTITQVIPQGPAVDRTRAQIAEYRRFRKLVQELIAVSEQLCNAQLQQPEALVVEESKKKPLRRSTGHRRRGGE